MIEINNSKYYNYNEIHQILSIPKSNSKTFCCFLKHYFYVDGFVRLTPTRLKGSISQSATSGKWNPYNANLRDREQIMFLSEKKMFIRGFVSIETEQIPKSAIIDPNIAENDVFPVFKVTFCDDCYINDELSTQNSSYFISSIDEFKETLFGYNENNEEITLTDYSSEKTIQMLTNMKSRFVSEEFLYFYRLEDIKKQCKASGKKKINLETPLPIREVKPLTQEINLKRVENNNSNKIINRQALTIFTLTNLLGEYPEYQNDSNNLNISEVGRRLISFLCDNPNYDFEGHIPKEATFRNSHSVCKKQIDTILKELIQDCMIEIEKKFSKK